MRRLLAGIALLLSAGTLFGQTLKQNALISIHTLAITLEEGVTMDQYLASMTGKFFPVYEKILSCEVHLLEGVNRDIEDKVGVLVVFKSKKDWNQIWKDDGTFTESGMEKWNMLRPTLEELNKLGTYSSENVVDWVIQ